MEGKAQYPRIVIRVAIDHKKNSPRAMKKAFLEIRGVDSVKVNAEEDLVYITGKANPTVLLRAAEMMGKSAEIISYEKEPPRRKKKNGETRDGFIHKAEDYVPELSLFDASICRDPYCLHHGSRPFIGQLLPEFHHGYHHHQGFYGRCGSLYEDHHANRCSIM